MTTPVLLVQNGLMSLMIFLIVCLAIGQAQTVNQCFNCYGLVGDACNGRGQADKNLLIQDCNLGLCHVLVSTRPGKAPYIRRGCGAIPCTQVVGMAGNPDLCGVDGKLLEPPAGQLYNQTRRFSSDPRLSQGESFVQYCKYNYDPTASSLSSACNGGPISEYTFKDFYYFASAIEKRASIFLVLSGIFAGLLSLIL